MRMKRTNLYLKAGQIKQLKAITRRTGAPVSDLIRRGIDEFIERHEAAEKGMNGKTNAGAHDRS